MAGLAGGMWQAVPLQAIMAMARRGAAQAGS